MKINLILTARDAAAAYNILEISKYLGNRSDINYVLFSAPPASNIFDNNNIQHTKVDLPIAVNKNSVESTALIEFAKQEIDRFQADAILCGLSTPVDGGIDEAFIAAATSICPSFLMQDFWGAVNSFFGTAPDYVLAIDKEGQKLTENNHNLASKVIGSPRHSSFNIHLPHEKRLGMRKEMKIPHNNKVIGFFGQALQFLNGYVETLHKWCQTINKMDIPISVVYKHHPRESCDDIKKTEKILHQHGISYITFHDQSIEDSLLFCDVVCSIFSNCNYDSCYINHFSSSPLIVPVALFFNEDIKAYCKKVIPIDDFAFFKQGLAIGVKKEDELFDKIKFALTEDCANKIWLASKNMPCPTQAKEIAINFIINTVTQNSATNFQIGVQ